MILKVILTRVVEHLNGRVTSGLDPTFTKAIYNKASVLMSLGRMAESVPVFDHAIPNVRSAGGGYLVQGRDLLTLDEDTLRTVTRRPPSEEEMASLRFAWIIAKHVKSNAIVYARDNQLVGVGAGQMSRVDSAKIGVMRANMPIEGTVLASDAFFPFRDGVDAAAEAGVTAVIQPGGSMRDEEVIAAADEHGLAMVFTGIRHFRH